MGRASARAPGLVCVLGVHYPGLANCGKRFAALKTPIAIYSCERQAARVATANEAGDNVMADCAPVKGENPASCGIPTSVAVMDRSTFTFHHAGMVHGFHLDKAGTPGGGVKVAAFLHGRQADMTSMGQALKKGGDTHHYERLDSKWVFEGGDALDSYITATMADPGMMLNSKDV